MSAKIVNLRRARRRRAREAARAQGAAAAARHGEPRAARSLRSMRADLEARRLEGHRLHGGLDGGEEEFPEVPWGPAGDDDGPPRTR